MSKIFNVTKSDNEEPVPTVWRDTYRQIVEAFRNGNFSLQGIDGVNPLSDDDADAIRRSIHSYGGRVARLPEEAWNTSIARWTGSHWDVLVDLFIEDVGLSDLAISSRVKGCGETYLFVVDCVYVP
ncbi:DUF7668 domain-containing protein [Sphingomonas sanguinis]|uniref:DUF7668 domain-containing protein n=1 Tax=Sphingomonas sanguinis TaxID=33051 RepID=UPI00128E97D3|nr:hypothetical protein [Sphingomonas sanguinis]